MTREAFETSCSDLRDRVAAPALYALKASGLRADDLKHVIIIGGAVRTPFVQEALRSALGREELARVLNQDEAVAMGAIYQAAHLGRGFRVDLFDVKESNLIPIEVSFPPAGESTENRVLRRLLFDVGNPLPQKRVLTFPKHREAFSFLVSYNLTKLPAGARKQVALDESSSLLANVTLDGVGETFARYEEMLRRNESESEETPTEATASTKGIRAHFRMDEDGVLGIEEIDVTFDVMAPSNETSQKSKGAFEGLSDTLSSIFSTIRGDAEGSGDESGEKPPTDPASEPGEEPKPDGSESKYLVQCRPNSILLLLLLFLAEPDETTPSPPNDTITPESNRTANDTVAEAPVVLLGPLESKQIREKLEFSVERSDWSDLGKGGEREWRKRLDDLDLQDRLKEQRGTARNKLESYLFRARDQLYDEKYELVSTEEERDTLRQKLTESSEWLDDETELQSVSAYEQKENDAREAMEKLDFRASELRDRPKAEKDLDDVLNATRYFLTASRSILAKAADAMASDPESGAAAPAPPMKEKDLDTLEKLINDTEEWRVRKQKQQSKLKPTDDPKLTTQDMVGKMKALDREVKYLVNRAKYAAAAAEKAAKAEKAKKEKAEKEASSAGENDTELPFGFEDFAPPKADDADEATSPPANVDDTKTESTPLSDEESTPRRNVEEQSASSTETADEEASSFFRSPEEELRILAEKELADDGDDSASKKKSAADGHQGDFHQEF